jgi:hypothetical protein
VKVGVADDFSSAAAGAAHNNAHARAGIATGMHFTFIRRSSSVNGELIDPQQK